MKHKIAILAAAMVVSACNINAETTPSIVSIDSTVLLSNSKEGKQLVSQISSEVRQFQEKVEKKQQELVALQEELGKQSKLLSKEALSEKAEEINRKKKTAEREFADKEEQLTQSIERRKMALGSKQMGIIDSVCKKEGWGLLIDRRSPGVLFVAQSTDRTEQLLKIVDSEYDKALASAATKTTVAASDKKASLNPTKTV